VEKKQGGERGGGNFSAWARVEGHGTLIVNIEGRQLNGGTKRESWRIRGGKKNSPPGCRCVVWGKRGTRFGLEKPDKKTGTSYLHEGEEGLSV